ncbi:DNA primase [Corynebacterium glutamicum MB001]|uniref:DNA primase n=2 Tax=Corynebacterium glutamicum TaxID=1718 RepID=Q8NND6_CORGL|nr:MULTISPECIES: DNA primase [Corynebacterium]AGN19765.1 DNA primase [Corynebacterium glutamicum SCgG1]AGN22790.1 DNA primase [Corynebacterium glutamicum SCgG2]AGT05998.1 DNA primase [Corynebacterium glutamicum MB001]AIK85697.1 DNA primase [Corynebacterium glutamicum]AIK88482.1 DNA primase [Corynebacterium glutamicum]
MVMAKGRIPESDIQAIRERTPIEEIVGDYVQLKSAGADSLKGLSPFKDEKTPSFHVRPNRGYYHCFSTGKGGDVFSFLMEMEHISFPEAVEVCAEKIGYQINYQGGGPGRREEPGTRQRLILANKAAHQFYREQLETPEAQPGREFLLQRGFGQQHIYHFECGYAPAGWDTLTKHLLKKGFEFKELEAAGLSKMGKRGPIDQFQRRLLWPIKNLSGDVIGFGARKLFDDDKMGKYMNTPETLLYKKSKVLFGLDSAKKAIAAGHQAVVVEGYTDVMAMHAAGIDTAVASCGTAFGEEHLQMLRRLMLDDNYFRGELIYTFDGDEAGQKAAMRAFEGDQKFTGQSFVSVAPNGMDPCDLRLERGDAAVRDLVARRIPMFEFVIQSIISEYTLDTVEGRLAALRRAVPIVADIRDKTLQSEYARLLSGWVGWSDPSEVLRQVHEEARRPKRDKKPVRAKRFDQPLEDQSLRPTMALPNPRNPVLWQERESLKIALQYPELAGSYFDGLPTDSFTNPAYRMVRDAISAAGGCERALDGTDWLPAVSENMTDILGTSLVSELAMEPIEVEAQDLESYTDGVLSRLQETRVGNQIAILKGQLQRMRPSEDEQAYNSLFSDLVALEQARRELLARAFRG